jgi:hypothetical protein
MILPRIFIWLQEIIGQEKADIPFTTQPITRRHHNQACPAQPVKDISPGPLSPIPNDNFPVSFTPDQIQRPLVKVPTGTDLTQQTSPTPPARAPTRSDLNQEINSNPQYRKTRKQLSPGNDWSSYDFKTSIYRPLIRGH